MFVILFLKILFWAYNFSPYVPMDTIRNPNSKLLEENYSASPHPACNQIKSYHVFLINIFLGRLIEVYRHFLSKCFKKVVVWRQEMVHVFSVTKQKHFCWKTCQLRKYFGCVLEAYYFPFQRNWDLQNKLDFFEWNCVLEFNQSQWLKQYVEINTQKKKKKKKESK